MTSKKLGPFVDITLGSILQEVFEATGMTQVQLAKKLGVRQPRVVEVFASESLTERVFDNYCRAMGVKASIRMVPK